MVVGIVFFFVFLFVLIFVMVIVVVGWFYGDDVVCG